MLVLTRRINEAVVVGNEVVVRVLEVRGTGPKASVKLGIEAPKGTKILREEVEKEVAEEMSRAASTGNDIARVIKRVAEEAKKKEKKEKLSEQR